MEHDNPGTLVLKPSRIRLVAYLVGSLSFVAVGIWGVMEGRQYLWATIIFFGLGSIVFLVQLHPRSSSLTLTNDKFVVRSLFRGFEHSWDEVDTFFVVRFGTRRMVAFNYSKEYLEQQRARRIAAKMFGAEAGIPGSFGMSLEQLASIMNAWKHRAHLSD